MLNSFWGKLAQRANLPQTDLITTYDDYWKLINDDTLDILGDIMVTDDVVMVTWRHKDNTDSRQGNVSIAIASFVTAYARLELYKLMNRIETQTPKRILYHDTDSVLYIYKTGDIQIECGDYLGDLADEVTKDYGDKAKCVKFVSLGPKNYAYVIRLPDGNEKAIIKVKGINLTEASLDIINFKSMLNTAIKYIQGEPTTLSVPQMNIYSDAHHGVYTRYFPKIVRAVSEKRIVDGNDTVPFGYKDV